MFAIITPALITGAFAERMKFSAMLVYLILWSLFIYDPMAHMVWGKGGFSMQRLAAAFRRWILPVAQWCTSRREFPRWFARCISESGLGILKRQCRRIAW